MATGAQGNQIAHHVAAKLTPGLQVMNLQLLRRAAVLTPPTVSFQHLVSDNGVFFRL
jgi:hypothetical protein